MPKPHSLFRLAESLYNTPHAITPQALTVILDYFRGRNFALDIEDNVSASPITPLETSLPAAASYGVLCIDGSLTYKPVETMCGTVGTSYQSLLEQMQEMADSGLKTVVMLVSSGGGQGSHVFETAQEIRTIADENGITLIGYADEYACSAAYALICVCDTVIANPSSELGSIGVLVALMDQSKALEQAGLKPIFITAGEDKVPYANDGSFKASFLEEIQESVDKMNAEFIAHVSKYTGLDAKTIAGFQARSFDGATAVSLGLANAVMTNREFAAFVAQATQGNSQ